MDRTPPSTGHYDLTILVLAVASSSALSSRAVLKLLGDEWILIELMVMYGTEGNGLSMSQQIPNDLVECAPRCSCRPAR
jgi:hypothetical protein